MSDKQLHLVRHGEVFNPEGVLYGRLPNFRLSELGEQMAKAAARELAASDRSVSMIIASPLERAQQSAAPIAEAFNLPILTDERIIEPTNAFEGSVGRAAFRNPKNWYRFVNPFRPSWGEPYRSIATRVRAAMDDAWDAGWEAGRDSGRDAARDTARGAAHDSGGKGDIVMVSHQAVVWAAHRDVNGEPLFHNPAKRRCELSSITTFERRSGRWFEVNYRTPAADLMSDSTDVGAV